MTDEKEEEPFLCQNPVGVSPQPRCREQCASCKIWVERQKQGLEREKDGT